MNWDQFKKKASGTRYFLQPPARLLDEEGYELPDLNDEWMVDTFPSTDVATLRNLRTNHLVDLGKDNYYDYRSDATRSKHGTDYGHLVLKVEVFLQGHLAWIKPNATPGSRSSVTTNRRDTTQLEQPRAPIYKKVWVAIVAIAALIGVVLKSGPEMLTNAEKLPAAFMSVTDKLSGWYFDDAAWSGLWSANPQGPVGVGDMNLSKVDLILDTKAGGRKIDGTIATKKICEAIPVFHFIMIEGTIGLTGKDAQIVAYDWIDGKRRNFATLNLKREGAVLIVTPTSGEVQWFPESSRIGLWGPELAELEKPLDNFCKKERDAFFKELHERRNNKK
jgi:hypothetical protein